MNITNARPRDMNSADWHAFEKMPKTLLYVMAKHLAAISDGDSYEGSLETGSYLSRMLTEWEALYANGLVPQKPQRNALMQP